MIHDVLHIPEKMTETQERIATECANLRDMLLEKNRRYGNSALSPCGMFSKTSALEQIAIRCDDKLKRIQTMGGLEAVLSNAAEDGEDTVKDLIGYLVLARVVRNQLEEQS